MSRFTASSSNPDVVQAGSERVLVDNIPSEAGFHNCGALHFGPDDKFYIAVGDSGDSANAPSLSSLAGKILRINADGSVPSDNPFVGQSNRRPQIWAYGLRTRTRSLFSPERHGCSSTKSATTAGKLSFTHSRGTVQRQGLLGLRAYLSSRATNSALTVEFDDYVARPAP